MSKTSPTSSFPVTILKSRLSHQGGLEKQTHKLAKAFSDCGCTVTILTSEWNGTPIPSAKVVNVAHKQPLSIANLLAFEKGCRRWLMKNPTQIVFGLDRNRSQTHYRAGNGVHANYLEQRALTDGWLKRASFALNPLHRTILSIEKQCFQDKNLKKLFVNSKMVADDIQARFGVSDKKLSVVHNGVEWSELQGPFEDWQELKPGLCQQRRLDPHKFQFLFVGQGYERKGLSFLLEGLAKLKDKEWQLSIVGKDRHTAKFKALATSLRIDSQAFFFGAQSPVTPFYQMADALCIPSTYDPFANVTVEALAYGVPVVTSKYNGGSEILSADTGVVIESLTEPESVADALIWAQARPKNDTNSRIIRQAVSHLTFDNQLAKMVNASLSLATTQ